MLKTRDRIFIIVFSLILIFNPFSNLVEAIKTLPESSFDFYVYDELYSLDNNTKDHIINVNKEIYKKTGSQLVVAVVNSLNNLDINTYASALFEKWEIGSRGKDNGILILMAPNDREMWIEVGYGLEGVLPDSRVKRIINESMLPYFDEDDYDIGLRLGFDEIIGYIEKEYEINIDGKEGQEGEKDIDLDASYRKLIIGLILLFLIADLKLFRGHLLLSILRASIGMSSGGSAGSGGGRGSGGRSGGGGAGGRW